MKVVSNLRRIFQKYRASEQRLSGLSVYQAAFSLGHIRPFRLSVRTTDSPL